MLDLPPSQTNQQEYKGTKRREILPNNSLSLAERRRRVQGDRNTGLHGGPDTATEAANEMFGWSVPPGTSGPSVRERIRSNSRQTSTSARSGNGGGSSSQPTAPATRTPSRSTNSSPSNRSRPSAAGPRKPAGNASSKAAAAPSRAKSGAGKSRASDWNTKVAAAPYHGGQRAKPSESSRDRNIRRGREASAAVERNSGGARGR